MAFSARAGEGRVILVGVTMHRDLRFVRADTLSAPESVFEPGAFTIEIGGSSDRLGTKRVVWRSR